MRKINRFFFLIFLTFGAFCYGENSEEEAVCVPPAELSLSHHFGQGVGHKGYTSAEIFLIETDQINFSPFLDLRFHVLDEGKVASNFGLGFRTFPLERMSIGGNFYYDYRASSHLHTHQIAGGFELLNEYIDFRLNGYLPVGGTKHSNRLRFEGFSGNQIDVKRKTYYAYPTVNAELGVPLPWISPQYTDIYVAVGPYYLFGRTVSENHYEGSWGVKGRVVASVTNYLDLEFEVNHDRVYHTTYQGMVAFRIPLYKRSACRSNGGFNKRQRAYSKRTLRAVMRNEIIPIKKQSKVRPLKDGNGNVISAFFVNNLVACPGFGTFESPFCSTALAEAAAPGGAFVYVYQGNGTTTNYDTGFVMKPGQVLQGSGISVNFQGIYIPAQTSGSPVVTNPAGDGITIASSTTIRGMTIENTSGHGINGGTLSDAIIENNTINNSGLNGINIADHSGTVAVISNVINRKGEAVNGISIDHATKPGKSYILNNQINNAVGDGVLVRLNHPDAFSRIANNSFTRTIFPALLVGDIGTEVQQGYLEMVGNTMNTNTFWAVHALDGNQLIANNQINNVSALPGQAISYSTTGLPGEPRSTTISNNEISVIAVNRDGIGTNSPAAGINYFVNIGGNQVTTSDLSRGIQVGTTAAATVCAVFNGNTAPTFTLDGNGGGAVNMHQTQADYNSQNAATTGFVEINTVNFGTGCTGP